MGVSTNGQICFGVMLEEGVELPWGEDIEEWWRKVNDFKDVHEPWTEEGEYAEGWEERDPRFKEYYDARREWLKKNPLPVALVNYCSGDYPMYILAVPETFIQCSRGYPTEISVPDSFIVTIDQATAVLDFIEKYEIECDKKMRWWLSSYYG